MRCPEGKELPWSRRRTKRGRDLDIYHKKSVCEGCLVRAKCTRSKYGRSIEVPVKGYEELVRRRQEWEQPQIKEDYKQRAGIIEPVFAQIKNVMGVRRWSFKGLEKVRAQWQMLCAGWNLKVLIRQWRKSLASA